MAKKITDSDEFNPATQYLPDGSIKNRVYDGDDILEEGTEVIAEFVQDLLNPFHKMGRTLGQFLNGVPDNQTSGQFMAWLIATILHSGSRNFTALTADSIVYSLAGDYSPLVYKRGLTVQFVAPSANTSITASANINGIGAIPISDSYFTVGSPAVKIGTWAVGDLVTLRYDIVPTPHFRVVSTPLSRVTNGDMDITDVSGTVTQRLRMKLGRIFMSLADTATSTTWSLSVLESGLASSWTDSVTSVQSYIDWALGKIGSNTSSVGYGTLDGNIKGRGLNFSGGPNSAHTAGADWRPMRVEIGLGVVTFVSAAAVGGKGWLVRNAAGTDMYEMDFGLPAGAEIFSVWACYTTVFGAVNFAPVKLVCDPLGVGSIDAPFLMTIVSDDNDIPGYEPEVLTAGQFLRLFVWYDGSSLV